MSWCLLIFLFQVALKDFLHQYGEIPIDSILSVDILSLDEDARVSVLWLLSESAPEHAPDVIATVVDEYESQSAPVKLQVSSLSIKFFKSSKE